MNGKNRRQFAGVGIASLLATAAMFGFGASAAQAESSTAASYSATTTVAVPPASTYKGDAGGAGWALAIQPDAVYTVLRSQQTLEISCHLQSDASECWSPRTITDENGDDFASSAEPGLYSDATTGNIYVYATRISDSSAGVVCIDTAAATTSLNPFCGYTVLAAPGQAPLNASLISGTSAPVTVGTRWYAFNVVDGASTGEHNHLLCFDTDTKTACPSQPFAVVGDTPVFDSNGGSPDPSITAIGSQIVVPYVIGSDNSEHLACFDTTTNQDCAGAYPLDLGAGYGYVGGAGAAFPLLSSDDSVSGFCLPMTALPCFSQDGEAVATPAGMAEAIMPQNSSYNGASIIIGSRVYVPYGDVVYRDGHQDAVNCYDYSTSAACVNFPVPFSHLHDLYTINSDPQRPSCIWVTSEDVDSGEIQNFDAYTGGACEGGRARVLASSLVSTQPQCTPQSYQSLQIVDPSPSAYSGATVSFVDSDSNAIPNAPSRAVDAQGLVDLTGLDLGAGAGLPQFVIQLADSSAQTTSVTVQLNWTGLADSVCGASVPIIPTSTATTTPSPSVTPASTSAAAAGTKDALAATGATVTPALTVGALLTGLGVLLGGVFVVLRRNRSKQHAK